MQNLVIVESPTKARTLSRFLGDKYQIEASMGHVRDLPKSDIGVDVENNFEPRYIIPKDKTKRVNELKKIMAEAKTLWLATDPDREGEAIAWHLEALLNNTKTKNGQSASKASKSSKDTSKSVQIKRVVFHEITPEAVKEAFENPRGLDFKLIDAQQARRVLDRLVGYRLSPLLWKKVKSGLSAGRVQSVALRLIVEREKEINAFKPEEYWSLEAELGRKTDQTIFKALLVEKNNKKISIKKQSEASDLVKDLEKASYLVEKVEKKEVKRSPAPPFTTSTLQQTANFKLGLTAKKTMSLAQLLYELGLITYMRTDSVNLSPVALSQARKYIDDKLGKDFLPPQARVFTTKSKLAQEAHEAIRPTNISITTDQLKGREGLTRDHYKLYDLIWKRMVASQMSEALMDQTSVDVQALNNQTKYLLRATGSIIKFEGWMRIYGRVAEDEEKEEKDQALPELVENEALKLIQLLPEQHFTQPPARFSEAALIKKLEELGIGRPSTYAPILSTIQNRYYVEKRERKFIPTELGIVVTDFLVEHFPDVIDYSFTAGMEDELDEVAHGERDWRKILKDFYGPFEKKVEKTESSSKKVKIESEVVDKKCPECGKNLVVRYGKFGKFLACSGFPHCHHTETLEEKVDVACPNCGGEIVIRRTKKGLPFYGCKNWPTCKFASWTKPK